MSPGQGPSSGSSRQPAPGDQNTTAVKSATGSNRWRRRVTDKRALSAARSVPTCRTVPAFGWRGRAGEATDGLEPERPEVKPYRSAHWSWSCFPASAGHGLSQRMGSKTRLKGRWTPALSLSHIREAEIRARASEKPPHAVYLGKSDGALRSIFRRHIEGISSRA